MVGESVTCFIRMAEPEADNPIPSIEQELEGCGYNIIGAYRLDKVPLWVEHPRPQNESITLSDGMQAVFAGEPRGGFDFEGYLESLPRKVTLSRGVYASTGEPRWVLMANYHRDDFTRRPEVVKMFNWDVMRAMALMTSSAHTQENTRLHASSDGLSEEPLIGQGIVDIIGEAEAKGLRNEGFFYTFAGVPFRWSGAEVEQRSGVKLERWPGIGLARGIEIIAEGPVSAMGDMSRIRETHPYTNIYVGGRLVA